jgi:RNA polymerase sigma-70 factor (ECF subfamily)
MPDGTPARVRLEGLARDRGRLVASLAARFRDLDIAEEAAAEAYARAAEHWADGELPSRPDAWLYRVAERTALDLLRRRRTATHLAPEPPPPEPTPEDLLMADDRLIPDERLRLIFVCCHPAVAGEARAALTLRLVCGLSTGEIAAAFLVPEATLAQRLVRAKRKIAQAGVPFEIPGPAAWPERLDAVLSTLEIAYAKAHEDAAGAGPHANYATEILGLTQVLAELLPHEAEVLSLAALVRYAEARRPARQDATGASIPLADQDPDLWRRDLIATAEGLLSRAAALAPSGPRALQAAIQAAWCARTRLDQPPPWRRVLRLYDALLLVRDDPVVRLNRAVALAEVAGPVAAWAEVAALDGAALARFIPYHALRADLLRRLDRREEARAAYQAALDLAPAPAEGRWLARRMGEM